MQVCTRCTEWRVCQMPFAAHIYSIRYATLRNVPDALLNYPQPTKYTPLSSALPILLLPIRKKHPARMPQPPLLHLCHLRRLRRLRSNHILALTLPPAVGLVTLLFPLPRPLNRKLRPHQTPLCNRRIALRSRALRIVRRARRHGLRRRIGTISVTWEGHAGAGDAGGSARRARKSR